MQPDISPVDQLYLKAEELSQDFSLFPRKEPASFVKGLLTESQIDSAVDGLKGMEVDEYIAATVAPTEDSKREGSKQIIKALDFRIFNEIEEGPLYCAEVLFKHNDQQRVRHLKARLPENTCRHVALS